MDEKLNAANSLSEKTDKEIPEKFRISRQSQQNWSNPLVLLGIYLFSEKEHSDRRGWKSNHSEGQQVLPLDGDYCIPFKCTGDCFYTYAVLRKNNDVIKFVDICNAYSFGEKISVIPTCKMFYSILFSKEGIEWKKFEKLLNLSFDAL